MSLHRQLSCLEALRSAFSASLSSSTPAHGASQRCGGVEKSPSNTLLRGSPAWEGADSQPKACIFVPSPSSSSSTCVYARTLRRCNETTQAVGLMSDQGVSMRRLLSLQLKDERE